MTINLTCPQCGCPYRIKEANRGRKGRCKRCGAVFVAETSDQPETTAGGSVVYRHQPRTVPFEFAHGDADTIEAVTSHIEAHLGAIAYVMHEIVSDLVHIDIHVVAPTKKRPWTTLVTSGMSDSPMNVPSGHEDARFAELMLALPREWSLKQDQLRDESIYWPIRLLKMLARLPHEYDTWLGIGHTVPNGDPPQPYAENTDFSCAILLPPVLCGEEFSALEVSPSKAINFYAVFPLFAEETNFKLSKGTEALYERLARHEVNELMDVNRRNVCRRGLFRWS